MKNNEQEQALLYAQNEKTGKEVLKQLSFHSLPKVRACVAKNRSTQEDVLWRLAQDRSLAVRLGVAANKSCPEIILAYMAKDPFLAVRIQVAKNPQTSFKTLEELSNTDITTIKCQKGLRGMLNYACAEQDLTTLFRTIANHPKTTVLLVEQLIKEGKVGWFGSDSKVTVHRINSGTPIRVVDFLNVFTYGGPVVDIYTFDDDFPIGSFSANRGFKGLEESIQKTKQRHQKKNLSLPDKSVTLESLLEMHVVDLRNSYVGHGGGTSHVQIYVKDLRVMNE